MDLTSIDRKMEFCPECSAYGRAVDILRGSTEQRVTEFGLRHRLHSKNCATGKFYRKVCRSIAKKRSKTKRVRAKRAQLKQTLLRSE